MDKLYKFWLRESKKFIGYSRHEYPDFVWGHILHESKTLRVREDEKRRIRDKYFIVQMVLDKEEIEKNTWHIGETHR